MVQLSVYWKHDEEENIPYSALSDIERKAYCCGVDVHRHAHGQEGRRRILALVDEGVNAAVAVALAGSEPGPRYTVAPA